ncbi:MAG TPA: DUF998 domain-containing protein [Brevundimonas sp.]|jgi:hypothetical membrane protein|uniref:DUF998 domain-containing protein n=1 Tax=Brevundimonas sp. TaxID=1871086 RepID=UPI002DEAF65C|nr:DUF998 domain-containing protein [Brevundimonas sp.]
MATKAGLVRTALWAGPVLLAIYYGAQVAGAAAWPGYDPVRQVASELGAAPSPVAGPFNAAIVVVGLLALVNAAGHFAALRRDGAWLASAAAAAIALFGASTIVAGLFPLPDPRHAAGGPLVVLCMAYPVVMAIALRQERSWLVIFGLCVVGVVAAIWVMSGAAGVDRGRWAGAIQRPVALALLGPFALGSLALLRLRARRPDGT